MLHNISDNTDMLCYYVPMVNIMYLSILFMSTIKPGDGKMDSGANTFYFIFFLSSPYP